MRHVCSATTHAGPRPVDDDTATVSPAPPLSPARVAFFAVDCQNRPAAEKFDEFARASSSIAVVDESKLACVTHATQGAVIHNSGARTFVL